MRCANICSSCYRECSRLLDGACFNVMSQHVDWQPRRLVSLLFDLLAAYLKANLSRHFAFRADYGLYEYTAYVYREPK